MFEVKKIRSIEEVKSKIESMEERKRRETTKWKGFIIDTKIMCLRWVLCEIDKLEE